jgi:cytochrome c oxidase subunit 2
VAAAVLAAAVAAFAAGGTLGQPSPWEITLQPSASPVMDNITWFHNFLLWIIAAITIFVAILLAIVAIKFNARKNPVPSKTTHNTGLEVAWTIIPVVILAVVAVPTLRTIFDLRSEPDPSENALVIDVIGHQWWWEFSYPEYGFTTANEMHIPAGRAVFLNITSADVIHSFWVPQLNGKRDAVPGRWNHLTIEADEPGVYLGQCAEFCGLAHADMRQRVIAETPEDFEAWAQAMTAPATIPTDGLAAEGWATYERVCTACHTVQGSVEVFRTITIDDESVEVALAPNLTHYADRETFGGASFENTTEHLRAWLANPSDLKPMDPDRNIIDEGRILGMPNFGLGDAEIDGLVALLQSFTLERP